MEAAKPSSNPYETSEALAQYLLMHYGPDEAALPWIDGPRPDMHFPLRCVHEGLDLKAIDATKRGLDIGSAVGGSSFELARYCGEVIGVDYSDEFIRAGDRLRSHGDLPYSFPECGEQMGKTVARVPAGIDRNRVRFIRADAQALPAELGQFEVVLCCNLLCRLREPMKLLMQLPDLVATGGQLLMATPESWLTEHTPKENWLSGRIGQPPLLDTLKHILGVHFELTETGNLPFCIREHRRKFQWGVSEVSLWKRRAATK